MVSGLFAPTVVALFRPVPAPVALCSMVAGAGSYLGLRGVAWVPFEEPIVLALPLAAALLATSWLVLVLSKRFLRK